VSKTTDEFGIGGWTLYLQDGRIQVNLVVRWLDDAIRVETEDPLPLGEWRHVAMTYDGTRLASGIRVYVDGVQQPLKVHLDALNTTFPKEAPLRIGSSAGQESFTGRIADVRVYRQALSQRDVQIA